MRDFISWFVIPAIAFLSIVGAIVYADYATVTQKAEYYAKANKICYRYKPVNTFQYTKVECMEVK